MTSPPSQVYHDAQPSPRSSPQPAQPKQQHTTQASKQQTVAKQMAGWEGARPKEFKSGPHRHGSPPPDDMKQSKSNPKQIGNEDRMENTKFRFTWKPTHEECLDEKSGMSNSEIILWQHYLEIIRHYHYNPKIC